MTNAPINLNRARKDRARDEKRAQANANAALHGQTKAQKNLSKARAAKADKTLDQHKREE